MGVVLGWITGSRWWPYVVGALAILVAIITAGKAGEWRGIDKAKRKQAERTAKKQKDMRDAAASVDRSRDGVRRRLRDGKF